MSRHSFVFSSRSLRSLELEREALERDRLHRRYQSMCVARAESFKPRGRGTLGPEPGFLCEDPLVHNALFTGDNQRVRQLFSNKWPQNLMLLASGHDLEWHSKKPGIWSLCYKQEFITPLQITASRGYDKCLQHLLTSGADVDFAPGGKTALHESCENSQSECTRLLLTYGANPNSISEDGYTPLHLCSAPESLRCAELLLRFGCNVNSRTEDKGDTALHIAARFALESHVQLYLDHGASVNRLNESGQSPLHCVCAQSHSSQDADRYFRVCHYLIEHGASVEALDEEKQSALHLACRTVNYRMVDLLLSKGIDVNRMDYGGNAPMHKALQAVAYKLEHEPERTVRSLLNYGSIRIWPGAIPKVLRFCCQSPRTIEVLVNVYDRLKVTDDWVESVPLKVLQEHQDFYESLFALSQTPRSLQHLARCAIRRHFEGHCQERIPQLPLPTFLKDYLLLQFQGYIS
ncbi:ankyrin repeat and SOCS box protein 10 isoform X2 [Hemiscyllium ocellatum]|uniref:ankyrin repeat and SOCS box protein 10 isoform X2 n=1 Tax=Hemiscyllium ocellatum TaxID=170820 RepID=UPI00296773B2|nr:ankyrin repeat and SOCS box protein 10 isoform X2 [Hemiscyllium ocellatum]